MTMPLQSGYGVDCQALDMVVQLGLRDRETEDIVFTKDLTRSTSHLHCYWVHLSNTLHQNKLESYTWPLDLPAFQNYDELIKAILLMGPCLQSVLVW